jgi:hypothetical protein
LELARVNPPENRPLDGMNIMDIIEGKATERGKPVGFWIYPG